MTREENLRLISRLIKKVSKTDVDRLDDIPTVSTLSSFGVIVDHPKHDYLMSAKQFQYLKSGFRYIERCHGQLSLSILEGINSHIACDSYYPGVLSPHPVSVHTPDYQPYKPTPHSANKLLSECHNKNLPLASKAAYLMLRLSRRQLFANGNKRTAWVAANYVMLSHHLGVISVPVKLFKRWDQLMGNFFDDYQELNPALQFLVKYCTITDVDND